MNPESLLNIVGVASIGIITALVVFIMFIMGKTQETQGVSHSLQRDLRDTEEQAKLLVQTNIELNRTLAELDKKLNNLACLHALSRLLVSAPGDGRVTDKITLKDIEELGFEKALVFLFEQDGRKAYPVLALGYPESEMPQIQSFVESNRESFIKVVNGSMPLSSSGETEYKPFQESLKYNLKLESYIVAPIPSRETDKGFIFVGRGKSDDGITPDEKVTVASLGAYIAQALDSARATGRNDAALQEALRSAEDKSRQSADALEKLEEAGRRRDKTILAISRRLKERLSTVKESISFALEEKSLSEWAGPKLNEADRLAKEMLVFLDDLLELSTMEAGGAGLAKQSHELSSLTKEIIDSMSQAINEKQLQVLVDFPRNAEIAFFDHGRIKRVIKELIGNAVKYTPEKGSISVKGSKSGSMVQVDIADTGCGIPAQEAGRIFEEFFRADNPINQNISGAGLSLALAKSIIEAHGGKIWAKSVPGSGSTFSFTLPQ